MKTTEIDTFPNFTTALTILKEEFIRDSRPVKTETWQAIPANKPELETHELLFRVIKVPLRTEKLQYWREDIKPFLPWADDHFLERVGGEPLNPGVQWKNWRHGASADRFRTIESQGPTVPPQEWAYLAGMVDGEGTIYWRERERFQGVLRVYQKDREVCDYLCSIFKVGKVSQSSTSEKVLNGKTYEHSSFSWQVNAKKELHWILSNLIPFLFIKKDKAIEALSLLRETVDDPRKAGCPQIKVWDQDWPNRFSHTYMSRFWPKAENGSKYKGMLFDYGDLNDVVQLMLREPNTRAAYLPIYFPEDTGVVHGQRTPCSIGYHFIQRRNYLHMTYYLRSCDAENHLRDDLYLAVRLQLWLLDRLRELDNGWLACKPGAMITLIDSLHLFANDFIAWSK